MSPKKQPNSLLNLCIKLCMRLINKTVLKIEKKYPELKYRKSDKELLMVKQFLNCMLPARLFDDLCAERTQQSYNGDPRNQLMALAHPNLTVFRKADHDNSVPVQFWLSIIPTFKHLIVLDLKFICSDEILQVIGENCTLLQEINIVSRVDICKSLFNASVMIRNVSDEGLVSVAKLKHLKILAMDPPRNERVNKIGRCVSQLGIITLICELPNLHELRIDTCDIGSTLISTHIDIGPLSLRKINCHFPSAAGIRKLLTICPQLRELSVTHLSRYNKDAVLDEIKGSELQLERIDLSFFSFTDSLQQLLIIKGNLLTHFSLWEIEHSMNFDTLLCIGTNCPNLKNLCLVTQSTELVIPRYFKKPINFYSNLKMLTIGNGNFNIEDILTFFLVCSENMEKLIVKYQSKINIDGIILKLLDKGCFRHIFYLWLDCTLEISKEVVTQLINVCDNLRMLTVDFAGTMHELYKHINNNNLDLKLGSY